MNNKRIPGLVQQAIQRGSWVTLVLIVVVLLFLWSSLELGRVSAWIPQVILWMTLVVLLIHLLKELTGRVPLTPATGNTENAVKPSLLPALASIATMLFAVWLLGISMGAAFYCLVYFRWQSGERWLTCILFTLGMGLGVQLLFGTLMHITLYQGVVLQLFS